MQDINLIKAEIGSNIGRIFKEISGTGPQKLKIYIKEDMLIFRVRFYKVILFEQIKNTDEVLFENIREFLVKASEKKIEKYLTQYFNCEVSEFHFSFKARHEEALVTIIFNLDIENRLNTS